MRMKPVMLLWAGCLLCFPLGAQTAKPDAGVPYFQTLVRDARTRIREINATQIEALRKATPTLVLVDVREDSEWVRKRIPGAVHVGRGVLEMSIESKVPAKSTPIVVYCQGGGRSAVAADVLGKMGYTNVSSLAGGLAGYEASGLPVDNASTAK